MAANQKPGPPPKDPYSHPNLKGLKGEKLVQQLVFNDIIFYHGQTFPDRPTKREQMYMDKRIAELELAAGDGENFTKNNAEDPQELSSNKASSSAPVSSSSILSSDKTSSIPSIPFIQCEAFTGSKQGFVFTTGPHGTGYYLDIVAQKSTGSKGSKSQSVVGSGAKVKSSGLADSASKSQPASENNIISDEKG